MGTHVNKSIEEIQNLTSDVEGMAHDFVKQAETKFEGVVDNAKGEIFKRLNISKEQVESGIKTARSFAMKMLKDQPLAVAGIALGVGLFAGMIFVASMRSSKA